jgi:hypothetical protein
MAQESLMGPDAVRKIIPAKHKKKAAHEYRLRWFTPETEKDS